MKIIFLIPPSEGKNPDNFYDTEKLTYYFEKPLDIAKNASEKDLKCIWKRFEEAIILNKNINNSKTSEAIKRYSWVMFNAIDYSNMTEKWRDFFNKNFLIMSGMYWIVKPNDRIANYKLPIETKWLNSFWKQKITKELNNIETDYIVDLLPGSYKKMIDFKALEKKVLEINFLKPDGKKLTHWVKWVKWKWIKNICENKIEKIEDLWWEIKYDQKKCYLDIFV